MKGQLRANVLILGKTGVGKTSLFNYLFGREILKTGAGRPLTGMGLFEEEVTLKSGLILHIFDSWGMESDKTEAWKNLIAKALLKHQAGGIENWFHSIIFCISAKSARVEDFELGMIKDLNKAGNPVIIALTHADVSDEKGLKMRELLLDQAKISAENIIEVNSVEKTLLGGRKTKTFGKKEIIKQIQINLLMLIINRVPKRLAKNGQKKIDQWFEDCEEIIKKNVSFLNPVSLKKENKRNAFFNEYARSIFDEIEKEANILFYEAGDYFIAFSQCLIEGSLVASLKKNERTPFIQFQLHKNKRTATEIIGNLFTFIPVLGAFGKQIIRKKSQAYYLEGLRENKLLLENQLNEIVNTLSIKLAELSQINVLNDEN